MTNIRVLGTTCKGKGQGTIRVFKATEVHEAIGFMRDWIKYGDIGDAVCAILYENGKQKTFIKGYKKIA